MHQLGQKWYDIITNLLLHDRNLGPHLNSFRAGSSSSDIYLFTCAKEEVMHRTSKGVPEWYLPTTLVFFHVFMPHNVTRYLLTEQEFDHREIPRGACIN
jgi:hypothetical protein